MDYLRSETSQFYLKYLLLSPVTKLPYIYYISVSMYSFSFFLSLCISFFFNGPPMLVCAFLSFSFSSILLVSFSGSLVPKVIYFDKSVFQHQPVSSLSIQPNYDQKLHSSKIIYLKMNKRDNVLYHV